MREIRASALELARELYALDSVTQNRVLNGFLPTVLDPLLARKFDAVIHEGEKMLTAPCDWEDIIAAAIEKERSMWFYMGGRSLQAWLDDVAATLQQYQSNLERHGWSVATPQKDTSPEDTFSRRRKDYKKGVDPAQARRRLAEVTSAMRKTSKHKHRSPFVNRSVYAASPAHTP
jgi:hypothetical protein